MLFLLRQAASVSFVVHAVECLMAIFITSHLTYADEGSRPAEGVPIYLTLLQGLVAVVADKRHHQQFLIL